MWQVALLLGVAVLTTWWWRRCARRARSRLHVAAAPDRRAVVSNWPGGGPQ